MTDEELKAIEARMADAYALNVNLRADGAALVAAVRRLRALVMAAENADDAERCPWCGVWRKHIGSFTSRDLNEPHRVDCPAFTPDGTVK